MVIPLTIIYSFSTAEDYCRSFGLKNYHHLSCCTGGDNPQKGMRNHKKLTDTLTLK